MKELQQLLARRGFAVGEVDGKLGAATRAGVKAAQLKLGLARRTPTPPRTSWSACAGLGSNHLLAPEKSSPV